MKLIHVKDMQKFVQPVVDVIVDQFENYKDHPQLERKVADLIEKETAFAILSHRWSSDELTLQDVMKIATFSKSGIHRFIRATAAYDGLDSAGVIEKVKEFSEGHRGLEGLPLFELLKELCEHVPDCVGLKKLMAFCGLAMRNNCSLAWLDTSCIDRTSSAELEESIRSMFRWYRQSQVCIVHLAGSKYQADLNRDPWFTRGWTLQELLAPKSIKFYNADWKALTSLEDDKVPDQPGIPLWEIISRITGISTDELHAFKPGMHDIRRRLHWASKRQTTRVEDLAYCLIGIFDIGPRIAYGEGKIAFHRLQVELMRGSNDKGIFMWNGEASPYNSMLAAEPKCFWNGDDATVMTIDKIPSFHLSIFDLTNQGLRISLSLHDVPPELDYKLVGGESVETISNDPNEFFKLGILGYSSSNPLVILLRGRTYGSDILYERVPHSILTMVTKQQLPPKEQTVVVIA